jgi:hypothetical protein
MLARLYYCFPSKARPQKPFCVYLHMPPDSCYKCSIVIHKPSRLEVKVVKAFRLHFSRARNFLIARSIDNWLQDVSAILR